jgi:riboflavin kinase/FMN adenylyltransferase
MDFAAVRSLSPSDFVREILIGRCGARVAVCGFNYRYGAKAAGDVESLAASMTQAGGEVFVLPATTTAEGEVISSTRIRQLLEAGEVGLAGEMLGRPYRLCAPVVHGQGLGHTLGLPTINQRFPTGAVIPARGVYATRCFLDGVGYVAITNVGVRPTVGGTELLAESHLLDFAGDLYGREIACDFLGKIRDERAFDSLKALVAQIQQDIHTMREGI